MTSRKADGNNKVIDNLVSAVSAEGSCVVANEADLNLCNTSSGACRQKLREIVGTYQSCQ